MPSPVSSSSSFFSLLYVCFHFVILIPTRGPPLHPHNPCRSLIRGHAGLGSSASAAASRPLAVGDPRSRGGGRRRPALPRWRPSATGARAEAWRGQTRPSPCAWSWTHNSSWSRAKPASGSSDGGDGRRQAPVHRGGDRRRGRRAGARAGGDPRAQRRRRVPRDEVRPGPGPGRRRRPRHLPGQGPHGDIRRPAAVHPAHRPRRPLPHPVRLRPPRLRVAHQLRHLQRRAQAHSRRGGRPQPPPSTAQPRHGRRQSVRARARQGERSLLPLRQVGDDAGWPACAHHPHQSLQERRLLEAPLQPRARPHEPGGGHRLRGHVPEHVRADAVRPVLPPRRAARRRRVRLRRPPGHPLLPAELGAARRGHRRRHAHRPRHRPLGAPGARRRPPTARPRARAVGPFRGLQRRRGRHHRASLAKHQVPPRRSHGLHGALRPGAQLLQRRPADRHHRVLLLGVRLRHQPPADLRPVRGVLHRHAQHGLLRVPPHGRRRRHGVGEPASGARPRGGRAGVRAGGDHVLRAGPVPRRRRAARDGVPQLRAAVPVRAPRGRAAVRGVGQDGRGGAAARGGARVGRTAPPARRRRGGLHRPDVRRDRAGALRRVLGAAAARPRRRGVVVNGRRGRRRRAGPVLPGDGGGAELGVQAEPGGGRLRRAAGDPGGPAGHLRGARGPGRGAWRLRQPVQGAPVRHRAAGHRAARLARRLQPFQPGIAALGSCSGEQEQRGEMLMRLCCSVYKWKSWQKSENTHSQDHAIITVIPVYLPIKSKIYHVFSSTALLTTLSISNYKIFYFSFEMRNFCYTFTYKLCPNM